MRVWFAPGNNVPYGQDFNWYRGIPAGVVWEVADALAPDRVRLLADGYGYGIAGRPAGRYGNGALYIARAALEEATIVES